MANEVKKLQLINPSSLNQSLELVSSMYECQEINDSLLNPELLDVHRSKK